MDFVDSCYLIKHGQGWLLWDTGLADAIAAMPEGQRPADPRMTHWRRPKTLAAQLDQLGVKPSDIQYLAVFHTHPDPNGNMTLFPQSLLLRCSAWRTSSRRKRRSFGSITTRRSATARRCRPSTTSERTRACARRRLRDAHLLGRDRRGPTVHAQSGYPNRPVTLVVPY